MKRICLFAIVVMQLGSGAIARPASGADPSAPLDLQGYTTELGRWSESASRLGRHPEEAAALRKQLPDHWSVAVQEQRFLIPTQWLRVRLDRLAANPQLARDTSQEICGRLTAMLQDSQSLSQIAEPNSGLARAKLDKILKRREFRSLHAPNPAETNWYRLREWVRKLINRFFSRVAGHLNVTRTLLSRVAIALGLILWGWLIYLLARLTLAKLSSRGVPAAVDLAAPAGNWREWVEQSRAAAARGEYREAIRIIYGAAVRRLGDAGAWQVDPARTHREYLLLLPADSYQRPPLVAITTCFERVWYGRAQPSAVDYEEVLAELESLR
jgi:hypothetical protein